MTINRYELVKRHNPNIKKVEPYSPLSVGNGEFAFTCDITGLQTFTEAYEDSMPTYTQSQWGWHSSPMPEKLKGEKLSLKYFDTYGKQVGYHTISEGHEELFNWLRNNPHRLNLGRIGLVITKKDGTSIKLEDVYNINQNLDLWNGEIISNFTIEETPVKVRTICHPESDLVSFTIESKLITEGRLSISYRFPYGLASEGEKFKYSSDWESTDKHTTMVINKTDRTLGFLRTLDNDSYFVASKFSCEIETKEVAKHCYIVKLLDNNGKVDFSTEFSAQPIRNILPSFDETAQKNLVFWEKFWNEGGAIQLYKSKDKRAFELERRIVLSQYLTAIQCSGSMPPQETGLTCNSWYGKFHLEMHWWHAAHFPLWNRASMLEKSLWWYKAIMHKAKKLATEQGYDGVRWPKMVDPSGEDSPSNIGPLLIWQQPHPIIYAELCYKAHPNLQTLELYKDIVFNTAEFMADFAVYDDNQNRYVLGPPVIPAQENHKAEETINPTFELEYWVHALCIAQEWRRRLGMNIEEKWNHIMNNMSKPSSKEGVYLSHENCPLTYSKFNHDHPSMLGAFGILPGKLIDKTLMRNTLLKVFSEWRWDSTWGWDFPMAAMTAARLGDGELAIQALLMDAQKNTYLPNGHNYQNYRLPLYLPGNGGLLTAVAMMAAGWENSPEIHAPGFPNDGSWVVEYENIHKML
jgi:hypothetical protein